MNGISSYKDFSRRRILLLILFTALLILTALYDMTVGAARLSISEILECVFHPSAAADMTRAILWTLRFPASLTAVVVGAALGLSGAVMQTILHNPLASPYTLGVGAGAAFGASLAILCDFRVLFLPVDSIVPLFSFAFAMSVCLLIYALGRTRGMSSDTMVLAGIALLFLFRALQALLQYFADEGDLQSMVFWTFGSLQKASWPKLGFTALILALCFPAVICDAWKYTALLLGDEKAESLGVKTAHLKLRGFFLVSLLSAAAVCFVGTIGFIGLAGPHIARLLAGDDQRFYLPLSSLCGALLLSAASVISRTLHPGSIFPVGIITSLIGVPFFFALVLRRWRSLP